VERPMLQSALSHNSALITFYENQLTGIKEGIRTYRIARGVAPVPISLRRELKQVKDKLQMLRALQRHLKEELFVLTVQTRLGKLKETALREGTFISE